MSFGSGSFGSAAFGGSVGQQRGLTDANRANAGKLFADFVVNGRRLADGVFPYQSEIHWGEANIEKLLNGHPDRLFNQFLREPRSTAFRYYDGQTAVSDLRIRVEDRPVGMIRVRTDHTITGKAYEIYILGSLLEAVISPGSQRNDDRIRLGDNLHRIREEFQLSRNVLAQRLGVESERLAEWESGYIPEFAQLYPWLEALQMVIPKRTNLVQLIDITERIIPVLLQNPDEIFKLTPEAFERLIAERLEKMGYTITLTGATNRKDGGIDIIGVPKAAGNYLLAAQVKHHKRGNNSGRTDVDRLLSWQGKPFALGMLVTNTGFTSDARWIADQIQNKSFLRLRDLEDLRKWLANNFTGESREVPDEIEVAPGVRIKIPKTSAIQFPHS
jgi:transcriptional regulator with XRE-family HTH domain